MEKLENERTVGSHFLLSLQIIADYFDDLSWTYDKNTAGDTPCLRSCLMFDGAEKLLDNALYVVPDELADVFPADKYPYIASCLLQGEAPHICSLNVPTYLILNTVIKIFSEYFEYEREINDVISEGGSLEDLCAIGCSLFKNPVYVHDRLFSVIALPKYVEGMLDFERNEKTGKMHIPLWLINEFKFDKDYQETLKKTKPAIWDKDQYPHNMRSLYVNLREGDYYYGRMLINEIETALKPGQFQLADIFASYILRIIRRDLTTANHNYKDYADTMTAMLRGDAVDSTDMNSILETLGWKADDSYSLLIIQSQDEKLSIRSEGVVRSTIADILNSCFSFSYNQKLCVIVDVTASGIDKGEIGHRLAPVIRDAYMYVGMSSPLHGIDMLRYAYMQAETALKYIRSSSGEWISRFEDHALEYIIDSVKVDIPRQQLASPSLQLLREYDKEKGTQYYETLKVYIVNERNIPKTSAELYVHRTTLLYRLEKIREMVGLNLEDSEVRLYLLMSFRLMD